MSLMIITKNKRLKAIKNSLENELRELKDRLSTLEKNKGVDLDCAKCHTLKIENEKLKEESTRLNKFEKSTHCLNEMLFNQKPSGDKLGLGFNSFEASSSGTKEIKFVKAQKKTCSDGGLIIIGGPLNDPAAPKINMGPPPVTPGSEKTVTFQKSILGPRPKHIIVKKVKVPVASDNEVKQFYKPLSKPEVGFSKPNFRSKTSPPRRVNDNYSRTKTPQAKRHVGRQNQPHGFPFCNANGITHNFSAPRTPQSNGVVERKNRTLQEMSRTMLNEQSLPQKFWCNAVDTSTYILNRILIRTILGKTPYEILRGRKPTLDYFRVFGSKCFILNTKDYLTKFDPKSYEGVFLGYARDYVDRKSTSGICTFVGCCLTSWFSKKQTALAISTTEAEYVSAGKACQQALWMKQALIDYDVRLDDVPIMCDNKGAIDLSKNPVQHSRTKHIEIRHHFLRDNVQKGHISIEKVPSADYIADILTKPLKRESFNYLRLSLGMMEHIP
ncbi:retrovirus-related pol polyprotein from transposon TNT 1-94 [Tanacetum coccineum]